MDVSTGTRSAAAPALAVVAGCALGAWIGVTLRFPGIGTAALFPPYAILTTALLLSPPRRWWIYLLAASAGCYWPHMYGGASAGFVLMAELANYARALVVAVAVRRFAGATACFDTLRGAAVFLLFAAVLGPAAGASLGAGVVMLHGGAESYRSAWQPWFLSNALTGITLLPIMLITAREWSVAGAVRSASPRRLVEAGALALALVGVGGFVLLGPSASGAAMPAPLYAPIPLLLWAAVRFGPGGISASVLVVALLAIFGTLAGRGPFTADSPAGNVLHLQLFLFAVSIPLLLLSALMQEQQRTARALSASQRQYRTVIEDQTELVCRFTPDGTFTFVNGACTRSSGRTAQQLLGDSFWSLVPAERRPEVRALLARVEPERPVATWEQELSDGRGKRWEQWRVRGFFGEGNRIVDYQGLGQDITERKRAEDAQRRYEAQRMLAEALREGDRRKDEFLAMLAHELRNPLAPINTVVEILELTPRLDPQLRWAQKLIGRQVAQLTRLVDDLLDVARISRGMVQLQLRDLDLASVIATAVETSQPLLDARAVELSVDVAAGPLPVLGDSVRLAQVISNLLNNAAKFTPIGGNVRLRAARDGEQIVVRIADTGVGIPADMLERVFEPFTQVEGSRDSALPGLGLGLALVQRVVKLHHGTVEAQSEGVGRGTVFVVRLPAQQAPAAAPVRRGGVAGGQEERQRSAEETPPDR